MSGNPDPLPEDVDVKPIIAGDRRVRVRYEQSLKTFCQQGSGELDQVWWMGTVRDLSGNGIGFVVQHRFDPGAILTLELENAARTFSDTFQVRVVRVLPQPGCWFLGCTFLQPLTEDEVRALL
jgi:hypothetical protein